MNFLRKGFSLLSIGIKAQCTHYKAIASVSTPNMQVPAPAGLLARAMASLAQMHKTGPHKKIRKSRNPLNGNPFAKMNFLRKGFSLLSIGIKAQCTHYKAIASVSTPNMQVPAPAGLLARAMASLAQMHKTGPHKKIRKSRNPLNGNPFAKGVVLKTLIKKPKKPNSANRKCVLVRLSNGKEMVAYVPGIGHNLQEHNIVLVRVGRLKDCPGVKLKCVRGKFDLPHVIKQKV